MTHNITITTLPADYGERIRHHIAAASKDFIDFAAHVIDAGNLLLDAKRTIGDGNFTAWVKEECGIGIRTAQRYMDKARHPDALTAPDALERALAPSGNVPALPKAAQKREARSLSGHPDDNKEPASKFLAPAMCTPERLKRQFAAHKREMLDKGYLAEMTEAEPITINGTEAESITIDGTATEITVECEGTRSDTVSHQVPETEIAISDEELLELVERRTELWPQIIGIIMPGTPIGTTTTANDEPGTPDTSASTKLAKGKDRPDPLRDRVLAALASSSPKVSKAEFARRCLARADDSKFSGQSIENWLTPTHGAFPSPAETAVRCVLVTFKNGSTAIAA